MQEDQNGTKRVQTLFQEVISAPNVVLKVAQNGGEDHHAGFLGVGGRRRRDRVNNAGSLSSSLWPRNEAKELGGYLCVGRVHWRPPRT